jgi:hypothetical protein
MANNTGTFFNVNDNDGIPLVGVSTDGKVMINHLYGNCLIGSTSVTGTASQRLQVTGGAYVSGNLGIGTTNPGAVLDVRGNPWFSPNTTGAKATALRLGRFIDGVNAAFDIITDDNTGDTIEIQSNRFAGALNFSRASPSGIQTTFTLASNYLTGTSISIANTAGTVTKIQLNEAGNTYFNNTGAVLVGTVSSTGTASQLLQVTGGAYVSGNLGIGTTNPTTRLEVTGDITVSANSGSFRQIGVPNSSNTTLVLQGGAVSGAGGNIELGRDGINYYDANTQVFRNLSASSEYGRFAATGEFLVGTASTTGTASQRLQVTGGAYVSGSVGIGTTNPLAKLHVSTGTLPSSLGSLPTGTRIISDVDSGSNYLTFRNTSNNTTYSGLLFQDDNIGGYVVQRSAGDSNIDFDSLLYGAVQDHVFKTNNLGISGAGTEVVRIKQSGSVGIGTTNPTSKLHVVGGDIRVGIDTSQGIILTSQNGTKYRLIVSNAGVLSTVSVP